MIIIKKLLMLQVLENGIESEKGKKGRHIVLASVPGDIFGTLFVAEGQIYNCPT